MSINLPSWVNTPIKKEILWTKSARILGTFFSTSFSFKSHISFFKFEKFVSLPQNRFSFIYFIDRDDFNTKCKIN